MKITKLAELKRIPLGTKLRLVHTLFGPCNKPREVAKVSTTGIWFKQLDKPNDMQKSWLNYPKAKEFKEIEGGFEIYEGTTLGARYLYEEYYQETVQVLDDVNAAGPDQIVVIYGNLGPTTITV